MKNPCNVRRGASLAVLVGALATCGACHNASSQHVLNPGWNEIPPGPSPIVEETRPVSGVTGVVRDGVGRLFVRQGGAESLLIRTEENILPFITTDQQGGSLVVGFEDGTSYHGQSSAIEFHLTVVNLDSVELSGAGNVTASSFTADRLSVVHTGVGSIRLSDLNANRLELTHSGLGTVELGGAVQQQTMLLGGMGQCDARDLASAEADVTILGTGSATVRVSDRLDARIDGSGSVYYIGDPVVQRTGHGSGSVEPL
jgi:hypothetical protein